MGRRSEERRRGTAGRRKRVSWWEMKERRSVPVKAEVRGSGGGKGLGRKGRVRRAGPSRMGKLTKKC